MRTLPLKANHKRVAAYHASLADFARLGVKHETAVRAAFQDLLEDCTSLVNKGRANKWKLVPESVPRSRLRSGSRSKQGRPGYGGGNISSANATLRGDVV